jgi:diguanylate cyclase (GGDEF)-like protein/PAS domain S-box-containing protein
LYGFTYCCGRSGRKDFRNLITGRNATALSGSEAVLEKTSMSNVHPPLTDTLLVGQLIDIIPSPVFYKDVDGRYLGCNKAFESFCGLRREVLIGKTVYEIWPKDLADTYQAADVALLQDQGTQAYEAELQYADGSRHQVVFHRATFLRADGSLGGITGIAWDITDRVRAERAVQDQLYFVEQLLETIPSPAFFKDVGGAYLGCNRAFEEFCGLKRENLIGKTVFDVWSQDLAATYHIADEALINKPGTQSYEAEMQYADGSRHNVIFHRATFKKADGRLGGIVGVVWDVTERKRAEQALRRSEERFRRIVENAPFGIRVTDANDSVVFANRRFEDLVHYSSEKLAAQEQWEERAYPDPAYRAELAAQHARDIQQIRSGELVRAPVREVHVTCGDGMVRDIEVVIAVEDELVYTVFNDVTERNRAEQALRDVLQAETLHDPLTTLFNRRYLDQALEREFARAARSGNPVSVVMADIDHFKLVNDNFGHDCGDVVLQTIARQFNSHIRKGDTACRYGGEEFTLLLPDASLESACERADRMREAIRELSMSCNGRPIGRVSISIGVAVFPRHGDTPAKVLKAADEALLRAKKAGRDRVVAAIQYDVAG